MVSVILAEKGVSKPRKVWLAYGVEYAAILARGTSEEEDGYVGQLRGERENKHNARENGQGHSR